MKNKILVGIMTLVTLLVLPLAVLAIENVTNVQVESGDAEVTLSWDATVGATFYRIYHGTEPIASAGSYDLPTITTDTNDTSYTISDLINGTTYYFSVTAVDADSESANYSSPEASATPQTAGSSSDESVAFTMGSDVTDNQTIVLSFSHPVVLPANAAAAFSLSYNFDASPLEITSITFVDGSEEKSLKLETLPQEPGGEYTLEVPTTLISKQTNEPLLEADRAVIFVADSTLPSSAENGEIIIGDPPVAEDAFKALSAESLSQTEVVITFNSPVVLPDLETITDVQPFTLINNDNPQELLEVMNYTLDSADPTKVLLTTNTQTAAVYTIVIALVKDVNGTQISTDFNVVELGGTTIADTTPPEDATNLKAAISDLATLAVSFTFSPSIDSAGDLNEYIVYFRKQGESTFQESVRLAKGAEAKAILRNLTAATTYDIKVAANDATGNESAGAVTSITLPETGPEIALLAIGSLALAGLRRRKKKSSVKL